MLALGVVAVSVITNPFIGMMFNKWMNSFIFKINNKKDISMVFTNISFYENKT